VPPPHGHPQVEVYTLAHRSAKTAVHRSENSRLRSEMGLNPLLPGRNIDGCFTSGSSRNSDKAALTLATIIGWPACAAAWGSLAGARHYATSREGRHGPAPNTMGT
jgi:hypothetical protein